MAVGATVNGILLARCLWPVLRLGNVAEWLAAVAEFLIAATIYLELEHNREVNFLSKTTSEDVNRARGEIYEAYVKLKGDFPCLEERSKAFLKSLAEAPRLKLLCETQLVHFNELGYIASPLFARKRKFIKLFPHAAIFIWIILEPYIVERQKDTGPWFSKHFQEFTLKCLEFVLQTNKTLWLRHPDDTEPPIKLCPCYMKKLMQRLEQSPLPPAPN